ncbi:hypothetical protein [Mycobacterium sp. NPDC050441]|uniref:hypothetical protein n=1 Tax=Mycobacterium sp. NPDC050441 TaxID=3155403 RepID=UPI0033E91AC4
MRLALRPYLTAGVALVGAGVIAITPVAAPPPEIQTHAVQLSATAIDNPIEVFSPVFERVDTLVQQAIQAQIDNPFPIVNGLIAKGLADGQHLGAIAAVVGEQVVSVAANFPVAMGKAAQRAAGGDFTGAVGEFTPVFTGPFFQVLAQWPLVPAYVREQFVLAGQLASEVMGVTWSVTMGQALRLFTVVNAVAGALDELAVAIPAGDPGRAVNAVQHGVANVADAALSIAGGIRVHIDRSRVRVRNILNPPPPAPAAPAIETPAATDTDATPVSAVDAPESRVATTEPAGETAKETVKPLVRHSLVAVPGKSGIDRAGSDRSAKVASDVRDKISSTVKKVDEGIKKAFAKPEKKATSGSHGSGTGSSGAAGDAD